MTFGINLPGPFFVTSGGRKRTLNLPSAEELDAMTIERNAEEAYQYEQAGLYDKADALRREANRLVYKLGEKYPWIDENGVERPPRWMEREAEHQRLKREKNILRAQARATKHEKKIKARKGGRHRKEKS
jgi:hypothetical protein